MPIYDQSIYIFLILIYFKPIYGSSILFFNLNILYEWLFYIILISS
jgi:hypothetical protein